MGAVEGNKPVPHPDEDSELPAKTSRRPSHIRKKRRDTTTKVVRILRERSSLESDTGHAERDATARGEERHDAINAPPAFPDPVLHRPLPPPAPLPSETLGSEPKAPDWPGDNQRRKRMEDIIGTLSLAIMVAAMIIAMWLRMTGS